MVIMTFRQHWSSLLCLLVAFVHFQSISALNIGYCSTQNTGGGAVAGGFFLRQIAYFSLKSLLPDTSIYQSNGRCHDKCNPSYAFAIVQGQNCWCSNYIPAVQQSTGKCNSPCPGYPSDLCGNEAQALFGYIALDSKPSGTAGSTSGTSAVSTTNSPTSVSIPSSSRSMVSEISRQPFLRWLLNRNFMS
jgi:hypothetical protein